MQREISTPTKRCYPGTLEPAGWAVLALIAAACVLRFVYLEADPHYYGWFGHVIDEGRWTMHARSLVLQGQLIVNHRTEHLVAAPLFQLTSYFAFKLMGVSHFSARLFPAICGAAFLIILTAALWRRTTMPALLLGLSVVAFEADYVALSRVAVPEIVLILFELLIFLVLLFGPGGRWRFFWAGCLTAAAIGFKATSVSLLFVFAVAAFTDRDPRIEGALIRARIADGSVYLGGFLASVLLGIAITGPMWIDRAGGFVGDVRYALNNIVGFNSLYGMLRLPFLDYMSPIFNTAALGIWLGIVAGLAGLHAETALPQRRMLRVAAAWAAAYALVMLASRYAPGRYLIHVLTPAAILIAIGSSPFTRYRLVEVTTRLAAGAPLRVAFNLGVLTLPATVMLGPLVVDALGMSGLAAERFRFALASLAMPWLALTYLAYSLRRRPGLLCYFVLIPAVGAIIWFGVWIIATEAPIFWPTTAWATHFSAYAVSVLLFLAASALIAAGARAVSLPRGWALTATGLVSSGFWLLQLAPGFITPTFTVRNASQALGDLFESDELVVENSAEGLFLDNELRFRRTSKSWKDSPPERLVFAFNEPDAEFVDQYYERIAAWNLHVSDQYRRRYTSRETLLCFDGECPNLFVYKRR